MNTKRLPPEQAAERIFREKFADADCILLAGSVLRGEETSSSDLDIVVLYQKLENARRESFAFEGWPVEAFVQDLETLNYFFEKFERPSGIPSLPSMVTEGREIPGATALSRQAKAMAESCLNQGPAPWSEKEIQRARYGITDLCDDLREPRSPEEILATGSRLYDSLTGFYFRSQNKWSAHGKSIPRRWKKDAPELAPEFFAAFSDLFEKRNPRLAIALSEKILHPHGGWLFENFHMDAPKDWRLPLN